MAQVFSNDMVAHVWAQQRQQSGRSSNGNFYFEGRTLYSYGGHFPVGIFAAPGGPVFLNADSYTVSTSKHQSYARRAVSHVSPRFYMPSLAALADVIGRAGRNGGLVPADARDIHAPRVMAYLESNWRELGAESEGAAWLLRAIGSRAQWPAMRARLESKADRQAERNAARLKASQAREGRERAARPWPLVRETAWLEAGSYGQRDLRETIRDYRAARLATPKAHKRVRSTLWQHETGLRSILATAEGMADRHGNPGDGLKARGILVKLRRFKAGRMRYVPGFEGPDGLEKRQAALDLPTGAGWRTLADLLRDGLALPVSIPAATRETAERLRAEADAIATEREGEERQRAEIRDARRRTLETLRTFNRERRVYRRLVETNGEARHKARALDSILARVPDATPWGTERGFQLRPDLAERAARIATAAEAIAAPLEAVRDEMRTAAEREHAARMAAERAERERVAAMSPDERRTAWEAGEIDRAHVRDVETVSGPLLRAIAPEIDGCRVTGGTLETSQGATVPLRHAFRVFQFIAACRADGKAWTPGAWGPRHIRVGHFTVDSVATSGDFRAGCHSIKWPEVARLADRLGVAGCLVPAAEAAAELEGEAV